MSDVEHQVTDILLPSANISVFSKDQETLDSAGMLKDDWRFARVDVSAVDGDVEDAIESFKTQGAADLIIIQTDDINDAFTERLGELSGYCDEGTLAIVVGPVNDVYLYRQLIDMGVSDYLVRPIKPEILKDVISKALIKRLGVFDSRLIAFVGAKGGVGTSVISQICSLISSETMGKQTLLMDGSGGWSSLNVGMGFDPITTFPEVLRAVEAGNKEALDRMFCSISDKLSILASGADAMLDPTISSANYEAVLDNLMVKAPVVFVDLSSSETSIKKAVLARAHKIIVITTPTVTSLRACRSLIKEVSDIRGGEVGDISLVVNKAGISKSHEVDVSDIVEALELSPSAVIANLPVLFSKYESDMKDILSDKEFASVATAFLPILKMFIVCGDKEDSGDDKGTGIIGGFLSRLTSK